MQDTRIGGRKAKRPKVVGVLKGGGDWDPVTSMGKSNLGLSFQGSIRNHHGESLLHTSQCAMFPMCLIIREMQQCPSCSEDQTSAGLSCGIRPR